MKNKNIFLIGMMGSWKTTIGKKLANNLTMDFIDTDEAIENIMSLSINEIFKCFGENRFRQMETSYFLEKTKKKGYVFSTGGGIVLNKNNRDILLNCGITIFLQSSVKEIFSRIRNTQKRPLLSNVNNMKKELENIWNERKKYYISSSDHIIKTDDLTPNLVINQILNILNEQNNS